MVVSRIFLSLSVILLSSLIFYTTTLLLVLTILSSFFQLHNINKYTH